MLHIAGFSDESVVLEWGTVFHLGIVGSKGSWLGNQAGMDALAAQKVGGKI